jgi:hypothetical protein
LEELQTVTAAIDAAVAASKVAAGGYITALADKLADLRERRDSILAESLKTGK